ncbi:hypothetical protein GT347_17410 [Xylophilus rhododendri]|uniref:Uncharacterized protein n=1 Tax=Xylophilus rhododendri TaxID=2697032 RepID=A0A857J6H2_9BURK|nr:hypothetical protein [Xylophilus rhododendri]QHI99594.1 hypothetical protein GT347_17410 [Xylophilus rhododendri]
MGLLHFLGLRPHGPRAHQPAPTAAPARPAPPQHAHGVDLPRAARHRKTDFRAPGAVGVEAERARFNEEIDQARSLYRKQVRIKKIHGRGGVIGCVVCSTGKRPFKLRDDGSLLLVPAAGRTRALAAPVNALDVAQELRLGGPAPGKMELIHTGGPLLPDPWLDAGAISPLQAAAFAAQTGHSPAHKNWVDVFLPAPGRPMRLSTMENELVLASHDGLTRYDRYDEVVLVQPDGQALLTR